jgi:hypothetical protein
LIGIPSLILPILCLGLYTLFTNKFIGVCVTIVIIFVNLGLWNYFKPVWEGDASVYKNQIRVVDSIYQQANHTPFNVQTYSPSMIDYNYQYLFAWYGKKQYGFVPDRDNIVNTVFFIIEPDPWNKGYRDVWLKERIGDGNIVWQNTFPGNIVLQQRLRSNPL